MENVEQRYPITMAVLRNAIDRIASWKNVTPQAKTRKQSKLRLLLLLYQTRYRKDKSKWTN